MPSILRLLIYLFFVLAASAAPVAVAWSQTGTTGLPLPRFVNMRVAEVNMRTGPGVQYPVKWVYHRQYLPVEVIAEYGTWRKVRDWQATQGWIHQSLLSGRRTLIVTKAMRTVRQEPDSRSVAVAKVEPNVVGRVLKCGQDLGWCRIEVGRHEGWLRRVDFWGVYPDETID